MARPPTRAGLLLVGALALTASGGAGSTGAAGERVEAGSPKIAALSGAWILNGAGRSCRLQLGPAPAGRDLPLVGAPPACRASMPILRGVAGWALTREGALHLTNAAGAPILALNSAPSGAFKGAAEAGGDFSLTPVERRLGAEGERATAIAAALGPGEPEGARRAEARPRRGVAEPAPAGGVGGVYLAAREPGRPVCWLALSPGATGRAGLREARLEPSCADPGLRVFDPVAWRVEEDRLFLVARAGQSIGFTAQPDGAWRKEPMEDRPLLLTRP